MMKYIVYAFIGLTIVTVLGIWLRKMHFSPIEIKYKISSVDWFFPNAITFVVLVFCIVSELVFYCWLLERTPTERICWIFYQVLCNGGLVVLIIPLTSWVYSTTIKMRGLDHSIAYDERVKKIYFTITGTIACIFIFGAIFSQWSSKEYTLTEPFINRIIMWGLNVISIWVGFGISKKGKIEADFDKERGTSSFWEKVKKNREYYAGFFITAAILGALLPVALNESYIKEIIVLAWCIIIPLLIIALVMNRLYYPSERLSKRRFKSNFNKTMKKDYDWVYGQYKRESYSLIKCKKVIKLTVLGKSVVWDKADKTQLANMKECFKKIHFELKIIDDVKELHKALLTELERVSKERESFLTQAFSDAKERWEEEQNEEVKKQVADQMQRNEESEWGERMK